MIITQGFCEAVTKALFSAVIAVLFGICLLGQRGGEFSLIRLSLEYAAMSCVLTLGGGLLLEYVLRSEGIDT